MGCTPINKSNDINLFQLNPGIHPAINTRKNNLAIQQKNAKQPSKYQNIGRKSTKYEKDLSKRFNEDFSEYDLLLDHHIDSLSVKTEIFLSCKNLPKGTDSLNSFVSVSRSDGEGWVDIGKTEVCKYSINPYYIKSFIMNYHFEEDEEKQKLKFDVFYEDAENEVLYGGTVIVTGKAILNSKNQELENIGDDRKAKLTIKGLQKQTSTKYMQFKLGIRGKKITKMKMLCKILIQGPHKDYIPIYITEEKEQNPSKKDRIFYWDLVQFENSKLENRSLLSKIEDNNAVKFQIFELLKNERPKIITEVDIGLDDLKVKKEFALKPIKNELHFLGISEIEVVDKYSGFSFLVSQMEYKCYCFIDCSRSKYNSEISTALNNNHTKNFVQNKIQVTEENKLIYRPSDNLKRKDSNKFANGDQVKENILQKNEEEAKVHQDLGVMNFCQYNREYNKNKQRNQIKLKNIRNKQHGNDIMEIATLINSLLHDQFQLDSYNRCATISYGSNIPPDFDIICNCLSLTMDILLPEVHGEANVLECYRKAMSEFYLSGPGGISETFTHFLNYVNSETFDDTKQKYHVAFYIISSEISDISVLGNTLEKNCDGPFSIILTSIGKEFNSEVFEETITKYQTDIKEKGKRNNIVYINFNSFYFLIDIEDEHNIKFQKENFKYLSKYGYNRINEHFVKYVETSKISPLDVGNIITKNTPDFIEFRKRKMHEKVVVEQFGLDEKKKLLKELVDLKYSGDDFNEAFGGRLPTFDKHYIINQLNKVKIKNINLSKEKIECVNVNVKEFIRFNDEIYIDNRYNPHEASGKNNNNNNSNKDGDKATQLSKQVERKKGNMKICNVCNVNPINIVFGYCKHKYCCMYCTTKIENKECPICFKSIEMFVRLYNM